jgi:hypothetical protein
MPRAIGYLLAVVVRSMASTKVDCMSSLQPCSYPHQEPYAIEATARRCGDDRSSRLPLLDSHLPEQTDASILICVLQQTTRQRSRLQLVASTTTKANRANSESAATAEPQEWQAQECTISSTNMNERDRSKYKRGTMMPGEDRYCNEPKDQLTPAQPTGVDFSNGYRDQ